MVAMATQKGGYSASPLKFSEYHCTPCDALRLKMILPRRDKLLLSVVVVKILYGEVSIDMSMESTTP